MLRSITEGKIKLRAYHESKISKKLPVFYNPIMKLNRDISILVLKANKQRMNIALPLAGSGVRGVRFLKEAEKYVEKIYFNDYNENAVEIIKKK